MTKSKFQTVVCEYRSLCIIICALLHLQTLESAVQSNGDWDRCEDWQEWACGWPPRNQSSIKRQMGRNIEPGPGPDIPVFVLQRDPNATRAQALIAILRDLGLTNFNLVPTQSNPPKVVDWMDALEVDVAKNMVLDTFTSNQHKIAEDQIYAAMLDGVGYDAHERLTEAVGATMTAANWIALLRNSIGIKKFLLFCDDGLRAWQSTPRAFGALRHLLRDIPEEADLLLLDWSHEECHEMHCHSSYPSLVRAHSPLHFSAMLWTAQGARKVEPLLNPIWTSVHEMLATAIMGKALLAYAVRPADLLFVRPLDAATPCRDDPDCSAATATAPAAEDSAVELEAILLYPPEHAVLPQLHTRVEVLVRCRAEGFDCSQRSKRVDMLINGARVASHRTLLLASEGLKFVSDGRFQLSVHVHMPGHPGFELNTSITVDSAAQPHGAGQSLLACADLVHARCDPANRTACGAHGGCARGVCVCAADFAGDACELDLSSYASPPHAHLPAVDPAADPASCARNEARNREADRFHAYLARLFEAGPAVVFESQHEGLGLGAELLFAAEAVTHGARAGASMRFTIPDSVFTHFEDCAATAKADPLFSCFFAPLYPDNGHLCRQPELHVPSEHRFSPLPAFPGLGSWSLLSEVISLLTQPAPRLSRAVRRVKQAVGFREGLIGVHIRHGDACFTDWCRSGSCNPIPDVAAAVRQMLQRYPAARGVFLATDEADARDLLRAELPGVLVVTNENVDRRVLGGRFALAKRVLWGHVDRRHATESIVLDLMLLSACSYLVGNLRSSVSRVALHMMAGRLGFLPPFISLHPGFHAHAFAPHPSARGQPAADDGDAPTQTQTQTQTQTPAQTETPTEAAGAEADSAVRRDAEVLFSQWDALQFAADCALVDRFWVVPIPQHIGLGAVLHMLTNTLRRALHQRRLAVLDSATPLTYANPHTCPNRSLACYLLPLSSCTVADVERRFPRAEWGSDFMEATRPVVAGWAKKASISVPYAALLPPGLSQPYGHGFQQALMFGLLLRPAPLLARFIHDIAADIRLPPAPARRPPALAGPHSPPLMRRCIAVHFRQLRGYGPKFNGRKQAAEIFHLQLELVAGWLGISAVYLASDYPPALDAFKLRHPTLEFHSMEHMGLFPSTDAPGTMDVPDFLAEGSGWFEGEARDEALAMLANIYLLGSCQYFIGAVSSNVGRAARELMSFALDGEPAPASDVDNDVPFEHEQARPGFHISCAKYEALSL